MNSLGNNPHRYVVEGLVVRQWHYFGTLWALLGMGPSW